MNKLSAFFGKNPVSAWAVFLLFMVMVFFRVLLPPQSILSWDVLGYYLYLPATFIYNDLQLTDLSWLKELNQQYEFSNTLYQLVKSPEHGMVIKYTSGIAILLSPFFWLAHLVAPVFGYPADGLSLPYQYILSSGGMLAVLIGLWMLRKSLLVFFGEKLTTLLLVLVVLGTNYFQLMTFDGTLLTHNFLFMFYAILLWNTIRWHQDFQWIHAIGIGISVGWITLLRPSEAVAVLIPLLWNIYSWKTVKQKLNLIGKYPAQIGVAAVLAILMFLPQMLYWQHVTGQWLFYSYQNAGEGLDFLSPHTWQFLFSFRKGWFIYTPLVLFAFAGFFFLKKQGRVAFWPVLVFVLVTLYISSSWTCWWYAGGSFSSRTMVPAYTVLAVPLGFTLQRILASRWKSLWAGLIVFLVVLNLFQTWQFENSIISKERMTKPYYFETFGRMSVPQNADELLLIDRTIRDFKEFSNIYPLRGKQVFKKDFTEGDKKNFMVFNDSSVVKLGKTRRFSPSFKKPFDELTDADWAWMVVEAEVYIPEGYSGKPPLVVGLMRHKGKTYNYRTAVSNTTVVAGQWNTLRLEYLTPHLRTYQDEFMTYIWQRNDLPVYVNDFSVKVYTSGRNLTD